MRFLAEFLSQPRVVGAVAPSSRALAREMVRGIDWEGVDVIVELGPGTGSFTREIFAHRKSGNQYLGIETNAKFCEILTKRFSDLEIHQDSAANLPQICRAAEIREVDVIISGLPWASFSKDLQDAILAGVVEVLKTGGRFSTFAYLQGLLLHSGQRFKARIMEEFSSVTVSKTVWGNLPPAFVYHCSR